MGCSVTLYIASTFYKGKEWIYRGKSMAKYFNIYNIFLFYKQKFINNNYSNNTKDTFLSHLPKCFNLYRNLGKFTKSDVKLGGQ